MAARSRPAAACELPARGAGGRGCAGPGRGGLGPGKAPRCRAEAPFARKPLAVLLGRSQAGGQRSLIYEDLSGNVCVKTWSWDSSVAFLGTPECWLHSQPENNFAPRTYKTQAEVPSLWFRAQGSGQQGQGNVGGAGISPSGRAAPGGFRCAGVAGCPSCVFWLRGGGEARGNQQEENTWPFQP